MLMSSTDALYCARMLLLLHSVEARHLNVLPMLDQVRGGTCVLAARC